MPSLSRLFRSKSSLKSNSNVRDLRVNVEPELNSSQLTRVQVARLRKHVDAAQDALAQLDALVSYIETNDDALSDSPPTSSELSHSSPSASLSVAIHIEDMKRSTKALTKILQRHVPAQQMPTQIPTSAPPASSMQGHDLYPTPLRLPLRNPPVPSSASQVTYADVPSPFHEEMSFLDWQLRQQGPSSFSTAAAANRAVSLPPPPRDEVLTSPHNTHGSHFSTGDKTRKLRSMQGPVPLLDTERPLGMDELMTFLREGNSMRQL